MFSHTYFVQNFTNSQLSAYNGFYGAYYDKMMLNKISNQHFDFNRLISYAVSVDFKNYTFQYELM
jgi:hypothetical protein